MRGASLSCIMQLDTAPYNLYVIRLKFSNAGYTHVVYETSTWKKYLNVQPLTTSYHGGEIWQSSGGA